MEKESNNDDESENFTAFMASTTKVTETSLKASKTDNQMNQIVQLGLSRKNLMEKTKVNCSESMINCIKQSYKLANANVKLDKRLKKAQEKVYSLKKMNEDALAKISQLKNHQRALTDKVKFTKKDAFKRDEFKKALEEKILKLEVDLSKYSLTFKKYEASASIVEKVCLNQKHSWDTRRPLGLMRQCN